MYKKILCFLTIGLLMASVVSWANDAGLGDAVDGEVVKPPASSALVSSRWDFEQIRSGETIDRWSEHNVCTTEGLGALLGVAFGGWSANGTWYVFLFNDDYTPSIADTYAASAWNEHTEYDEATRPTWDGVASGTTTWTNSASKAVFTVSNGVSGVSTIYGAGLVSGVTKGDNTSGLTLYNIARFSSSKSVEEDDILRVTVTLTANPE